MKVAARVRAYWRSLTSGAQLDREMDEEMRLHVALHAERLVREEHLDPDEARRRAYVAFGGLEKYKEQGRDTRGLRWLDALSLDTRLGLRMLVKHRGLTFVGGFAMAVAIAIGATGFEMFSQMLASELPFPQGDRVVALHYVSTRSAQPERRVLRDFVDWRNRLRTVGELGAFRTIQLNLVAPGAPPEPIRVAEMTASGFSLVQTPPLLGRYLVPADEVPGAAPVVVIGYTVWQTRFHGDPQIVGRRIELGGTPHAIVGVMPEGFAFPVDHRFWLPLRHDPLQHERVQGPALSTFGRLAPGFSYEQAQAELDTFSEQMAASFPATHAHLRLRIAPYTREHLDLDDPSLVSLMRIAQLLVGALTLVVAINLAILFYARTVTRLGEMAVRTALGASRPRILGQLFVEALALAIVGAVAGLALADVGLSQLQHLAVANGLVPFWLRFDLSITTAAYAAALSVLAALIMGVLPGLKATGRDLTVNLHESNNRSGTRLGPVWSALVVAQVAAAVTVLPVSAYLAWQVIQLEVAGTGLEDHRFVIGTLTLGDDPAASAAQRLRDRQVTLMSRLEGETGVIGVTYSSAVPGFARGASVVLEEPRLVQRPVGAGALDVSVIDADVNFFAVYGAEMLAGRGLQPGDSGAAGSVVVNRSFADALSPGGNVLGLRFQYSRWPGAQPNTGGEAWHQIVGVVRDFPELPEALNLDTKPVVYQAASPGAVDPVVLSVRFGGDVPDGFPQRFRELGAEVDPALQLRRVVPLSAMYNDLRAFWRYVAWGAGLLTATVLLLSAAGIYAMMSFTVAQRTREIGIRTALGAHPRRILMSVFGRAAAQLGCGVLVGSLLSGGVIAMAGLALAQAAALLLAVGSLMCLVGLVAAWAPGRRGLRVQASEALRAEA